MPDCQFLYSGKLCIDSVPLCVCVCVCVCMCVRACVRACVRERGRRTLITLWRGRRTLITLWNRIEYEMSLNLKFGNWRYLHVSSLQVLLVILMFTAVARKRPRSFCQKCRWQVTAKHAYTLHEVKWCMVVWCTQNAPRWQQFHVAPAMPAL